MTDATRKINATRVIGGGSSAVAASAHAACARFRGTDPLITGTTRRGLAKSLGFVDEFGGIPDARWMRAMTFERLVRDERFASEVATTAVGRLGLDRPTQVVIVNARISIDRTAQLLTAAHERAVAGGAATMMYGLAVPFVSFEDERATDVKPDFAVVAPTTGDHAQSWLVMGDAKDYERVRSRIDDPRLLKGFLQVALGAESAEAWSRLPVGMRVHTHGVLAVPRNSFLQPEALVELLDDHRREVRMRVEERLREAAAAGDYGGDSAMDAHVHHLKATFDPASCPSCTLFAFCRQELRDSADPTDVLIEVGIDPADRPTVTGLVDGTGEERTPRRSVRARVLATVSGNAESTGQLRVDQAGQAGTINVVIAKSDSAALGVYGIAVQRVAPAGVGDWATTVFDDPQSATTRRALMKILGTEILAALKDRRQADPSEPDPVHLVVPDRATADVLASIADNLAGVELSRLRWARDKQMGRPTLTFNGEEAIVPSALSARERTAVSFLLEEDRARAFILRTPVVDVRSALALHLVPGGPSVSAGRLDYLVAWAEPGPGGPNRHRILSDAVENEVHTPGARLTNRRSNAIHNAFTGTRSTEARPARPTDYAELVRDELEYKATTLEKAVVVLQAIPESRLRAVYRAIEGDAQNVWRRRLTLHASDLVRFGRTYRSWRNSLVPAIEADATCDRQLLALGNPQVALDAAADAGNRYVAMARVVGDSPLVLEIDSRRMGDGGRIVLLHVNDTACAEGPWVDVAFQKGSFKFAGLSIGPLSTADPAQRYLRWSPDLDPGIEIGDSLVVADFSWFCNLKGNKALAVSRPSPDVTSSPKADCEDQSYVDDPDSHQFCCRPHEIAESEWSDVLAERRARGELNPDVWPPVVDGDAFEVTPADAPIGDPSDGPAERAPDDVTSDDLG